MKRQTTDDFAERNADFIFSYVEAVWTPESYNAISGLENDEIPKNKHGLYIFFIMKSEKKYPVYIGATTRSFNERFWEHFKNGKFKTITKNFELMVMCLQENPAVAFLMESVFLASFDFCLNNVQNGPVRNEIDFGQGNSFETSKEKFDNVFKMVVQRIAKIDQVGKGVNGGPGGS